ncbi:MAG: DUF4132 domain-containing protein, partial [Polyangiaceae bacterium]|nr:DUF4132 domain-containing protein [Polyangiaceae bacterium]
RIALAVPALAHVLATRSKSADAAGRVAIQLAKSDPAGFDAALATVSGADASALRAVLNALVVSEEASPAELPAVLREPPWLRTKRSAAPATTLDLAPLTLEESVVWIPGELGEYDTPLPRSKPLIGVAMLVGWKNLPANVKERSPEMDAFVEEAFVKSDPDQYFKRVHYVSTMLHVCSDEAALRLINEQGPHKLCDANLHDLEYLFSRFELRAFEPLLALAALQPQRLAVLARVASSRLALPMADAFARMKKVGPIARGWLLRFPEHAAAGLVPLALGRDKKARSAAERALRWMSQNGKGTVVLAVADRYGEPARAGVDALLAFDPLDDVPAKLPKPPAWLDASTLPRPVLRGSKKALPTSAVSAILSMLQFSPVDPPYAGLAAVVAACTPESLAELAWGLCSEWLVAGGVGKEDWALGALGHFGTDEIARRLAPKIRVWPGEAAHARAVKGLDVLAQIGTDVALMHLDGIAQKLKFKGLQEKAREKIAEVAESRGLTREELADRLVPDLDLDPDGTKTLDFGARTFKATFDEHLQPLVLDAAGKRQKDLPKPAKSDDAEKAAAAIAWWKAAKKDAKALGRQQILRLELAMCTARTWDAATFRTFILEHPLVFHLARRLVWGTYADRKLLSTFRVAEDRTLASEDDAATSLDDGATVGLVHRLALPPASLLSWGERFGDYELIQPFPQLQRPVFAIAPEEKDATELTRCAKLVVPLGKVLGLEERGWRRGNPQDAGWIWDMHKDLPDGVLATLPIGGGILAGNMADSPKDQELGSVTLAVRGRDDAVPLHSLDPIVFSELVRDLEELRG